MATLGEKRAKVVGLRTERLRARDSAARKSELSSPRHYTLFQVQHTLSMAKREPRVTRSLG